jgi:dCTP diphosphatase
MSDLDHLTRLVRAFRDARDWQQFHTTKNLVASIAIEAAELMECVQWVEGEEAEERALEHRERWSDEIADVAIYLLLLADRLEVDLGEAIVGKLEKNGGRYPVEKSRGNSTKYDALE